MASTFSTDLKLELMATGENAGTWGDKTNTNLNLVQQAIAGYQEVSIAGGAQTTPLVMSDAALSNARNAVIKFIGTITGNQVVTIPDSIEKTYIIENGTSGSFTVEFKTVSGTGVTFGTTDKSTKILFSDGTNIVDTGVVSLTGIQTLTNKTITSPTITSPTITSATITSSTITDPIINEINDSNGNEEIIFSTTASAVNEITVKNAATTAAPEISATGSDTNIDLKLTPKGSGKINLDGIKYPNADGTTGQVLSTDGSGNLSFATVSTYTNADALTLFNASGSAPVFAPRAWVNFNGAVNPIVIRASGNVSSITDNGVGNYTVNFTTAMQDANYTAASITLSHDREGQQATTVIQGDDSTIDLMSTTQIQICTGSTGNNSYQDKAVVCLVIFR
jgi:hypothetical protein